MGIEAALIGGGMGLLGSAMSSSAAKDAASASAKAQIESAKIAADAAKFRPVGITTRFGQSNFGFDPTTGYLTSAGYDVSPEMKAIQDRLMTQAGAYDTARIGQVAEQGLMPGSERLFNLGNQYLAESPEQAAQKYMQQQQGLLAPQREQQLASLRNQVYQGGRAGLATGGTTAGGMQQTTPEMAAYYNALAQQDAQLAANANTYGQQQATFGAGLLNTGAGMLGQIPSLTTQGYGPLQTQLGLSSTIEQLGQSPLDIGAQLGGRSATAGATQAQALMQGGMGAASTMQAANSYSPFGTALQGLASNKQLSQGLGNWFSGVINPNNTASPFFSSTIPSAGSISGGEWE